jgi:hypothetical protein
VRDLRELSGPWSGFWIQELVRGNMKLRLKFEGNLIEGSGRDPMGEFHIYGMFSDENQRVLFTKAYGAISVDYSGVWDGVMIYGRWTLHDESYSEAGVFEIWPDKEDEGTLTLAEQLGESLSMPAG